MSAPKVQVTVEPFDSGCVLFAPMASPALNKPEQGRLMLRLAISNLEPKTVQMESLSIRPVGLGSYSSKTLPLKWFWTANGLEQSAVVTIAPSETALWWFQHASDNLIFDDSPAPTQLELDIKAMGFSEPAAFIFPLAPHVAPSAAGAYLFPAAAADLEEDEYWETNGASHGVGAEGSQSFAFDLGVWTADGSVPPWLHHGANGTQNQDFRVWDREVHAMAGGTVNQVLFDVPSNPYPLPGPDWNAQLAAQKAATWGKYLTDNGYDYEDDQPHAGAGNHLYLEHGDEIVLYAHLQPDSIPPALRTPGASVQAGDVLGRVGNSGNSRGPHLHVHAIKGTQAEVGPLRPLVFAPFSVLETDLVSASPQLWVGVLSARALPAVDAFIWPAYLPSHLRPGAGEVAIDPLALVLPYHVYIILTLPDPPLERLLKDAERDLSEISPAARQHLVHRLETTREYLAIAQQAIERGQR